MTTTQILHELIADIRNQQVIGQGALGFYAKKKYTEVQTLAICAKAFNKIDKILRSAESEIR